MNTARADVRSMISSIINFTKSRAGSSVSPPCDGFILRIHYRWSFFIFLGGFFTVWYNWYQRESITCVSHYNAETQVRLDYVNICLSYPYVETEDGSRRYILFYRWIHWTFLVLAGIYYLPRKISKVIDNPKLKKLLEDVAQHSDRYGQAENQVLLCVENYMKVNLQTHNGLYLKFLLLNLLALLIDITALHFIDFVLQGNFKQYGFNSFPFNRDPKLFTDFMSQTFPPFVSCELNPSNQLTGKRLEKLGCHLTLMELYEKIFLYVWVWLIIVLVFTFFYLIYLLLMLLPFFRYYLLRPMKPVYSDVSVRSIIMNINKECKVGDVYLLYKIKQHLSHGKFYELLYRLSRENMCDTGLSTVGFGTDTIDTKQNVKKRNPKTSQKPQDLNSVVKVKECYNNI